jgi:DNA repair exonuclease SbcCD ATPase subunit
MLDSMDFIPDFDDAPVLAFSGISVSFSTDEERSFTSSIWERVKDELQQLTAREKEIRNRENHLTHLKDSINQTNASNSECDRLNSEIQSLNDELAVVRAGIQEKIDGYAQEIAMSIENIKEENERLRAEIKRQKRILSSSLASARDLESLKGDWQNSQQTDRKAHERMKGFLIEGIKKEIEMANQKSGVKIEVPNFTALLEEEGLQRLRELFAQLSEGLSS